eukprot:gene10781-3399_t
MDFLDIISIDGICLSDSLWEKGFQEFISKYENEQRLISLISLKKKELLIKIIFEDVLNKTSTVSKKLHYCLICFKILLREKEGTLNQLSKSNILVLIELLFFYQNYHFNKKIQEEEKELTKLILEEILKVFINILFQSSKNEMKLFILNSKKYQLSLRNILKNISISDESFSIDLFYLISRILFSISLSFDDAIEMNENLNEILIYLIKILIKIENLDESNLIENNEIISSSIIQNYLFLENLINSNIYNKIINEILLKLILNTFKMNIVIESLFFKNSFKLIFNQNFNLFSENINGNESNLFLILIQFNKLFEKSNRYYNEIIDYFKLFNEHLKHSKVLKINLKKLIFKSEKEEIKLLTQYLNNNASNLELNSCIFDFLFLISGENDEEMNDKLNDFRKIIKDEKWIKFMIKRYYETIEVDNKCIFQ